MKILIISDTHGRVDRLDRVLSMHRDADIFIFLGDGLHDVEGREGLHRGKEFAAVLGNCDAIYPDLKFRYPVERLINVGEYTILMMHGQSQGVKYGLEAAKGCAVRRRADFLLYGHTHEPEETYIPEGTVIGGIEIPKPLRILNPGSLGDPRRGAPSYALIDIRGKDILMSHGTIDY